MNQDNSPKPVPFRLISYGKPKVGKVWFEKMPITAEMIGLTKTNTETKDTQPTTTKEHNHENTNTQS